LSSATATLRRSSVHSSTWALCKMCLRVRSVASRCRRSAFHISARCHQQSNHVTTWDHNGPKIGPE
jgi:hypothetical protein